MRKFLASAVISLFLLAGAIPAFAQAGSLDPAFGTNGVVNSSPLSNFTAAAVAPNGDIVVAGDIDAPSSTVTAAAAFVRYLPNGTPDPSFGTNGLVLLPPPSSFFLGESFTLGFAIQSNGDIVATFYAFNNTSTESESQLIRLNANGTPDTTFGTGGEVPLNFPLPTSSWSPSATLVLAQPDGKILVTGNIVPPFRKGVTTPAPLTLLARYLSNGAVDTTFGTNGVEEVATAVDLPSSLALLSGDGILALNDTGTIAAAQFSSAGAPVTPATGGKVIAADQTGATAFQSNGEFLIAGTIQGTGGKRNADAIVERFELNGTQDTSFQSPAIRFAPDAPFVENIPIGVNVDSTGRVVVGVDFIDSSSFAGVARLNSNGTLDTTFGSDGIGKTVPGFVLYDLLVQPADNKIVIVSSSGNLARYLAQ